MLALKSLVREYLSSNAWARQTATMLKRMELQTEQDCLWFWACDVRFRLNELHLCRDIRRSLELDFVCNNAES